MYDVACVACITGLNKANTLSCQGESLETCLEAQEKTCTDYCYAHQNSSPKPKVHRHCLQHCQQGFVGQCNFGAARLGSVIDADWANLKKLANPHLEMHEL
jgi:hypothetical protein